MQKRKIKSGYLKNQVTAICQVFLASGMLSYGFGLQDSVSSNVLTCMCFIFTQANRPPAKLNLLTCQVKTNPEEKKCFDLISRRFVVQVFLLAANIKGFCNISVDVSIIHLNVCTIVQCFPL